MISTNSPVYLSFLREHYYIHYTRPYGKPYRTYLLIYSDVNIGLKLLKLTVLIDSRHILIHARRNSINIVLLLALTIANL